MNEIARAARSLFHQSRDATPNPDEGDAIVLIVAAH
jgi:hypothetical protein